MEAEVFVNFGEPLKDGGMGGEPKCCKSFLALDVAVMLVHHARKDSQSSRPGQALRGSSELHGWGDETSSANAGEAKSLPGRTGQTTFQSAPMP